MFLFAITGSIAAAVIAACIAAVSGVASTAAQKEMNERNIEFQKETNEQMMAYNTAEAQKNRDWQEQMSNTQVQRAMADYQAAGLNPILAATGGASYGSVSSAQANLAAPQQDKAVSGVANVMNSMASVLQTYTNMRLTEKLIDSKVDLNASSSNLNVSRTKLNNGTLNDLIGSKSSLTKVQTQALLKKLEYYANRNKTSAASYKPNGGFREL